ncbi:MAG: site-specific integrase [Methylococcaceae bacterium]|nr:site-specific integrase [Methylococcaceae bacterium]MDP3905001.1 site-specific integrase [Methylococcaceae bacterium]
MATIRKIQRQSGVVYKAIIKKSGVELKSKTFKLKRDATTWAKRIEADEEMMESLGTRGAGMRFSELVDEYIGQWQGKDEKNQFIRAGYWSAVFGNYKLVDITTDLIRQQLKEFEAGKCLRGDGSGKSKATTRSRSATTVNRYRCVLSSIFKYAVQEGFLTVNLVSRVPGRRISNQRTRFLNEDERTRLLLACKNSSWDKLHILVLMAMTTGMRKSELIGLRWSTVDFDKNLAFLGDTKNGEERYCPIPDFVVTELKRFRQVGNGYLFPATSGDQPFEFKKHWFRALRDAGIEHFRWHDLRHTCASMLVMHGATLFEAGQVLGHKSAQTTMRYAHLSTDHKSALVDRVMSLAVHL